MKHHETIHYKSKTTHTPLNGLLKWSTPEEKIAKLVVPYHPRPGACARPRVLAELLDSSKPAETLEIRKVQVGLSGNMVLRNQMDYKRHYQGFIMDYQIVPMNVALWIPDTPRWERLSEIIIK